MTDNAPTAAPVDRLVRLPSFSLQRNGQMSREQLTVINTGMNYVIEKECSPGKIPIGDVPYCERVFGNQPLIKQFYPSFLSTYMLRDTGIDIGPTASHSGRFIKPATKWKGDWDAGVTTGMETHAEFFWWSDAVHFVDEWRLYVANGKLHATGWYQGENEDCHAPEINVHWPDGFSGAVDFGRLFDGRIALVECHAPFACGWYGDEPRQYVDWQIAAWNHREFWLLDFGGDA